MNITSRILKAGLILIGIPIVVACGSGNGSCPAGQVSSQYGCLATAGCPANYGYVANPDRCVALDGSNNVVAYSGASSTSCPGYVYTQYGWLQQAGCPAGQGNASLMMGGTAGVAANCVPQVAYNPTAYPTAGYGGTGYQQPCPVSNGLNTTSPQCASQPGTVWNGVSCVPGNGVGAGNCAAQPGTVWNGVSCIPMNQQYPQQYPQYPQYPTYTAPYYWYGGFYR